MKKAYLPLMAALLLLISCVQELPPEPGIPGGGEAPVGKAAGVYPGFATSENLAVSTPIEFVSADPTGEGTVDFPVIVQNEDYVYKIYYVLDTKNMKWEQVDFTAGGLGISTVGSTNWISKEVRETLKLPQKYLNIDTALNEQDVTMMVIAYACTRTDTGWDCHGDGGSTGSWMLHEFTIKWRKTAPLTVALENGFAVKNADGVMIAYFDPKGNLILKGTKLTGTVPVSSTDPEFRAFVFKDSAGTVAAVIDQDGKLSTLGTISASQASCTPSSNDEFIVKDTEGIAVSLIDLTTGNICLTGSLVENYDFP